MSRGIVVVGKARVWEGPGGVGKANRAMVVDFTCNVTEATVYSTSSKGVNFGLSDAFTSMHNNFSATSTILVFMQAIYTVKACRSRLA